MTDGLGWSAESVALCASPMLPFDLNAAGRYTGSFTGGDNGVFQAVIGRQGQILAVAISGNTGLPLAGMGIVQPDGRFALPMQGTTSVGATFSGQLNATTGAITGTWVSAASGIAGTWQGARSAAAGAGNSAAYAGPYVLSYTGFDRGTIYLHIDLDGAVRGTIQSADLGRAYDVVGTVDRLGQIMAVARVGSLSLALMISSDGSVSGSVSLGTNPVAMVTGHRR